MRKKVAFNFHNIFYIFFRFYMDKDRYAQSLIENWFGDDRDHVDNEVRECELKSDYFPIFWQVEIDSYFYFGWFLIKNNSPLFI